MRGKQRAVAPVLEEQRVRLDDQPQLGRVTVQPDDGGVRSPAVHQNVRVAVPALAAGAHLLLDIEDGDDLHGEPARPAHGRKLRVRALPRPRSRRPALAFGAVHDDVAIKKRGWPIRLTHQGEEEQRVVDLAHDEREVVGFRHEIDHAGEDVALRRREGTGRRPSAAPKSRAWREAPSRSTRAGIRRST